MYFLAIGIDYILDGMYQTYGNIHMYMHVCIN